MQDSRLSLRHFVLIAYMWSIDSTNTQVVDMLDVEMETLVQYFQYFRDVCSCWLIQNPPILGGVGMVVQRDESVIAKRKYNRGRRVEQRWVFGMYDVHRRFGCVQQVLNRSAATLLPIIERFIAPGSVIHSDEWAAYINISQIAVVPAYTHMTVNHSQFFRDPATGVHTNNVECFWKNVKQKLKKLCGVTDNMLPSSFGGSTTETKQASKAKLPIS